MTVMMVKPQSRQSRDIISDCDMAHMSRELSNWMQAFAEIGLSAEEQDQIFWGTAARIFGVDEV